MKAMWDTKKMSQTWQHTVSVSEYLCGYWLYFNPISVTAGKALMNTDQSILAIFKSLHGAVSNYSSATSFPTATKIPSGTFQG